MNSYSRLKLSISLQDLKWNLEDVDGLNEYVIFGSASLVMRGILDREPGDIDLFVSKRVWGRWLAWDESWFVETPNAGDPPILTNAYAEIPIHAFYAWKDEAVGMNARELIRTADKITWKRLGEFRIVSVQEALRVKELALTKGTSQVKKHVADIEMIKDWLKDDRSLT